MKLPTEMLHATATIYVSNYLYLGLEFVISLMLVVYIQINDLITRQKTYIFKYFPFILLDR